MFVTIRRVNQEFVSFPFIPKTFFFSTLSTSSCLEVHLCDNYISLKDAHITHIHLSRCFSAHQRLPRYFMFLYIIWSVLESLKSL